MQMRMLPGAGELVGQAMRLCRPSSIPILEVNTDTRINQLSICQHKCHLSVPVGHV